MLTKKKKVTLKYASERLIEEPYFSKLLGDSSVYIIWNLF